MYQDKTDMNEITARCIECGGARLVERITEQSFAYGPPDDHVFLTASMPVFTCEDCGYEYFDERGEEARHAAVCRHLGVQTPKEIHQVREGTSLSRTEFCCLSGFGSASLQRWEAGMVVPNASSDRLIFLLRYPDNVERLRRRANAVSQGLFSCVATTADPVAIISKEVPEVHTRRGVKRFERFANRPRIALQAASWSLRQSLCM
jgi:DNA-binding transcriptional regulator YiaG